MSITTSVDNDKQLTTHTVIGGVGKHILILTYNFRSSLWANVAQGAFYLIDL